jgi:hypothetical protein
MFACGSPSGGGGGGNGGTSGNGQPASSNYQWTVDGVEHDLTITEIKSSTKAVVTSGNYELTVTPPGKTSKGTATAGSGGVITFTPEGSDTTFQITISSDNTITVAADQVITFTDGDTVKLKEADKIPISSDETTSGFIGATLTLTGQVYQNDSNINSDDLEKYTGSISVFALGETGTITSGQLSFSIGTPAFDDDIKLMLEEIFVDFDFERTSINPSEFKGNLFSDMVNANSSSAYVSLWREFRADGIYEDVCYVYVDRDVTFSANECLSDYSTTAQIEKINAYNITLKKRLECHT